MKQPTPQCVRDFWAHMQKEYGSIIVPKADSEVMKLVAGLLNLIDIQDDDVFMKRFTTTLGNRIYIPFEIGVPGIYDLWDQICVCVHEHQHIVQGQREGWMTFGSRYLVSPSYRANYEAEAYGCNMELEFWHAGAGFNPYLYGIRRVEGLKNYGCKPEHIEQAKQTINLRANLLTLGGVENETTQCALAWLNEHAPELSGL